MIQMFTVRNSKGQYLGTFGAKTEKQAIQKFIDSQAVYAATFRRSAPRAIKVEDLSAKVEG